MTRYPDGMAGVADSLLEQALSLPAADRVKLASDLLASVGIGDADPEEVERLWGEECERRVAQLDAGEADLLTWDQVLAEIEADRSSTPSPG
jgi:hypothetical protein